MGAENRGVPYYLHKNPQLPRPAHGPPPDLVVRMPLPAGGPGEGRTAPECPAATNKQTRRPPPPRGRGARFPYVRDRAIFVGSPEDVVPRSFGAGLPEIRPWVQEHFDFSGYVLAPGAGEAAERDPRSCIVTVGGSGVGGGLLQRVIDAAP